MFLTTSPFPWCLISLAWSELVLWNQNSIQKQEGTESGWTWLLAQVWTRGHTLSPKGDEQLPPQLLQQWLWVTFFITCHLPALNISRGWVFLEAMAHLSSSLSFKEQGQYNLSLYQLVLLKDGKNQVLVYSFFFLPSLTLTCTVFLFHPSLVLLQKIWAQTNPRWFSTTSCTGWSNYFGNVPFVKERWGTAWHLLY